MKLIVTNNRKKAELLNDVLSLSQTKRGYTLVQLQKLRKKSSLSRKDFDKILLQLSEDGLVSLFAHDYVASVSKEERESFLHINNQYFFGVSIRQ